MKPSAVAALTIALLFSNIANAVTDGPRYAARELDCIQWGVCGQGIGTENGVCNFIGAGGASPYLRFDRYDFSLPADLTSVDGITVEVKAASFNGCTLEARLAILNPAGDAKTLSAPAGVTCDGSAYQTLGGPTDTWGLSLSRDDVNAPTFGVVLTGSCSLFYVDAARITVHYSTATSGCGDSVVDGTEECDDGNTSRGDGCSSICEAESVLDKGQQKCVNSMNRAGAKLSRSVGRAVDKCVKGFIKEGEDFAACDLAYRVGSLASAEAKLAESATKLCDPAAPPFGFVDASTTSALAIDAMDEVTTLVVGAGPSLANTEPAAGCQAAVLKATRKVLATRASLFNKCKKDGLAGKNTTQIVSGSDLATCITALPDAKGRVDKAEEAIVKAFQAKCDDVPALGAVFAAPCGTLGSYQSISACFGDHIESIWCNSTAIADGIDNAVTCP